MKNEKAMQRDRLILEFGVLFAPIREHVYSNSPRSAQDYEIAVMKLQAGDAAWRKSVREFCTFGDDLFFQRAFQELSHVPERFANTCISLSANPGGQQSYEQCRNHFLRLLDKVPINWEPEVFAANTPFTSYLKIKSALAVVQERFYYFDRYLKREFFTLFLDLVPRSVEVRLVTTRGTAAGLNSYGVEGVLANSNLARQEFRNYQLIEVRPENLHDRNLIVDDLNFSLGPGTDRAGIALTNFTPADNSPDAFQAFWTIVSDGRVEHSS